MVDVLPEDLRRLRENKGLSQQELANQLGKSLSIVQKWEQGDAIPRQDALYELSELYGVDFRISSKQKHPLYLRKAGV